MIYQNIHLTFSLCMRTTETMLVITESGVRHGCPSSLSVFHFLTEKNKKTAPPVDDDDRIEFCSGRELSDLKWAAYTAPKCEDQSKLRISVRHLKVDESIFWICSVLFKCTILMQNWTGDLFFSSYTSGESRALDQLRSCVKCAPLAFAILDICNVELTSAYLSDIGTTLQQ